MNELNKLRMLAGLAPLDEKKLSGVLTESEKPDFADIDGDGDKKEPMKKAAKDKEEMDEAEQMREWANSIYKQYDDRGHYQEQPEGETVDLSLRRYLNADPMKVKIEEDHTEEGMLKEYKSFVSEKYAAYDKNNKVVGLYKDLKTAKELKPGHTYKKHTEKDKKKEVKEKADNPYAIGMAQAMKSTGDEPPLKKSTVTKAHKIAKKIKKGDK